MAILESVFLEALQRPIRGLFELWGTCEPWTVTVAQIFQTLHDLRIFKGLGSNPINHREVNRFAGGQKCQRDKSEENSAHEDHYGRGAACAPRGLQIAWLCLLTSRG